MRNLISKSLENKSWNNQPLSEDIQMRSFNALKLEHLPLKFDLNKLNQLSVWDEVNMLNFFIFFIYFLNKHLLRLCVLRRFGYLMASLSQTQKSFGGFSFFEYDLKTNTFSAIQVEEVTEKDKQNPEPSCSKEDQRLKLMKSMAQLRLEAEISQLESTFRTDDTKWSPYLVMDASVLCESLKMVQELSRSCKFLIIIPLTVIDQIDLMKKESKQAREAIKWLEIQFKNGNRFLRAQNQHEINDKANLNLRKKDYDFWRYSQIIDCCIYFQNQFTLNNQDSKQSNVVSLLTNNQEKLAGEKFTNLIKSAKENGIFFIFFLFLIHIFKRHTNMGHKRIF